MNQGLREDFKAGFIGVVGMPNAGKSTLVNILTQEKVSIVTEKPQTTRRRVLGIVNRAQSQQIFVDAPGFIKVKDNEKDDLNRFIEFEARSVVEESDVLLVLLNVDEKFRENLEAMVNLALESAKPWIAVISKTDIKSKSHRGMILREWLSSYDVPIISISNKKPSSSLRQEILSVCEERLPESPAPLYGEDIYTSHSVRDIVAELIREQCFMHLYDEVPFALAVNIVNFDESSDKIIKIYAEILVEKENHRPIVIGKGGSVIKKIGTHSRTNIEKMVDKKVFLDLKVKVHRWSQNSRLMKELGYVTKD